MDPIFELMMVEQQKKQLETVLECNKKTEKFGLVLSEDEVTNLMVGRKSSLSENQRVEFGEGVLPRIIDLFCDSQFINQENYADTLSELQEIFYLYKNETQDELTDAELLEFMKKQYEEICFGDLDYLKNTCLERFGRSVRSGYQSQMQSRLRDEYSLRDTENEYNKLSEETRWEYEVYRMKLHDLL
ncbi:MAG: hypothetical protein K0S47_3480 [Herbinix sp.]|jgi:hypothetical protein|nr:hypothetical protein [Herbinix sp.]